MNRETHHIPNPATDNVANAVKTVSHFDNSVSYTYDAGSRVTGMTVNSPGFTNSLTYTYNDKSLLNSVISSVGEFVFTYDEAGRKTKVEYPNGVDTTYTLAPGGRVEGISVVNSGSTTLEQLDYTYEPASGFIESVTRDLTLTLVNADRAAGAYDKANRTTAFNGETVAHDANGNLTQLGDTTYTWDMSSRLIAVNTPTSYSTYTYDANGNRVSKTVDGVRTDYVYDGLDVVLELINNTPSAYYVRTRNIDQPLARVELNPDGTVERVGYYHADVQGSIIAVTDEDGAVIERYAYSPFGVTEIVLDDAEFDNPYYFTGKPWDVEAALMYFNARYYSPEMGRFISVDPIGFESGDLNFYRYVGNNPVNYSDPLGLAKCTYSISSHTMVCGPNSGGNELPLGPDKVFSGVDTPILQCRNNPSEECQSSMNIGPIPEGEYDMILDGREGREKFWILRVAPLWKRIINKILGGREGFWLHPGSVSLGCITAKKNNIAVMRQYDAIHKLLISEQGSNTLQVVP
ncbi:RHS repeat-associated core domain-containing protein [Nitrospirota bacterium]